MGSKVAPTYATLVLGFLEQKLYSKTLERFGEEAAEYIHNNWHRFLDDCFIIWLSRLGNIVEFTDILNELHPDFQFVEAHHPSAIPMLDVMVKKLSDGKIVTDIFHKATDTRRYLPYNSCHPGHTRRNIPYSLARRVAMIVSDKWMRDTRLKELRNDLIKCNYPKNLIEDAILKFRDTDSETLRIPSNKEPEKLLTFVNTFNPANPKMFPIIKQSLPMLSRSQTMNRVLTKNKIIESCRQPKNLKRLLTKSEFQSSQGENLVANKVMKCKHNNCGLCNQIIEGESYTFRNANLTFKVKYNMNCTTPSVIYCLECANCGKYYIGQTGGPLQKRMTLHRQHIRHERYRILHVSQHIAECAGQKNPQFKVFPFYKCINMNESQREAKEQYFIKKLKPQLNQRN